MRRVLAAVLASAWVLVTASCAEPVMAVAAR